MCFHWHKALVLINSSAYLYAVVWANCHLGYRLRLIHMDIVITTKYADIRNIGPFQTQKLMQSLRV